MRNLIVDPLRLESFIWCNVGCCKVHVQRIHSHLPVFGCYIALSHIHKAVRPNEINLLQRSHHQSSHKYQKWDFHAWNCVDGSKLDEWKSHEPRIWGWRRKVLAICFRKRSTEWRRKILLSLHQLFEWKTTITRWHTGPSIVWWD